MTEDDWETLLLRIRNGKCTPFLGAGAAAGTLPLGSEIAAKWAAKHGYPLDHPEDLAHVAQFLGVHRDAMFPKELIKAELAEKAPPDFTEENEPHAVLARLPLPVYMTTNYDDFMVRALRHVGKDPQQEICRWNDQVKNEPGVFVSDPGFSPTKDNPVVFHLHGRLDVPESLVLTEDDYLDFLVTVSREDKLLPYQITTALARASLLFIGYRLADWNFRVLHRGLVAAVEPSQKRLSVTVQLRRTDAEQQYLDKYFERMEVRVYWGKASDFVAELRERWEGFDARG